MRSGISCIAAFVCLLMALFSGLPILKTSRWWIRSLDFPRLQIVALLGFTLTVYVLSAQGQNGLFHIVVAVSVAALAWQAWMIAPYTRFWPVQMRAAEDKSDRTLRLLLANVLQHNRNSDAVLMLIKKADADIVLLTEVDEWWTEQLCGIRAQYAHTLLKPLSNTYGIALYSRFPLEIAEVRYLLVDDIPSVRVLVRMEDSTRLMLWGVHPSPPRPGDDTQERDGELLLVAKEAADSKHPAIVAGDLNDVAWSRTTALFQKISGLLDPRIGRGLYVTFNANWPLMKWPLDHLFASKHWTLVDFRRLGHIGSDHYPILVALRFEPTAADQQEANEVDRADAQEAEQRIREGREAAATD